jgi:hypothetical protein
MEHNDVLTFKQIDMMKHAWGYSEKKPGFRTHYCTELNDPAMVQMVKEGFFHKPQGIGLVAEGYGLFYLTEKAITRLKAIKKCELL